MHQEPPGAEAAVDSGDVNMSLADSDSEDAEHDVRSPQSAPRKLSSAAAVAPAAAQDPLGISDVAEHVGVALGPAKRSWRGGQHRRGC